MAAFRIILIFTVFILLLILALMNAQETTTVRVFHAMFKEAPVSFVMLYSFAFGALCVGVFTLVSEIQLRARLRRQSREIDSLMEELRAFRNAPLDDVSNADSDDASDDEDRERR
jgi:uncharacterized integral membrane protein